MRRTPRLRLRSMPGTSGVGSLIRGVGGVSNAGRVSLWWMSPERKRVLAGTQKIYRQNPLPSHSRGHVLKAVMLLSASKSTVAWRAGHAKPKSLRNSASWRGGAVLRPAPHRLGGKPRPNFVAGKSGPCLKPAWGGGLFSSFTPAGSPAGSLRGHIVPKRPPSRTEIERGLASGEAGIFSPPLPGIRHAWPCQNGAS